MSLTTGNYMYSITALLKEKFYCKLGMEVSKELNATSHKFQAFTKASFRLL